MRRKKIRNGGFVFVEFAIALPLLILLMCGLGTISVQLFKLGKDQLADYALETEARYVMERITQEARAAKEIEIEKFTNDIHQIKIVYHTVDDDTDGFERRDAENKKYYLFSDKDIQATRFFTPRKENNIYKTLTDKRQDDEYLTTPITGGNSFGDTKINILKYSELNKNVLRIELEMESLATGHKIKIATAVFMPGCETLEIK